MGFNSGFKGLSLYRMGRLRDVEAVYTFGIDVKVIWYGMVNIVVSVVVCV